MKRLPGTFVILLAGFGAAAFAARPHTPFVEKVVTPERSRQLKVALHPKLWVLYDLPQAQLYQAWQGGADGGILDSARQGPTGVFFDPVPHFAHWFITKGENYFKESVGEYFSSWTKPADIATYYKSWKKQPLDYHAWTVTENGRDAKAVTQPLGYVFKGDLFRLDFALALPDGRRILVTETPEYADEGGKTTLVRKLAFTGMPAGCAAALKLAGTGWTGQGVQGNLFTQSSDGESTFKASW
jgi:hypothetical protein